MRLIEHFGAQLVAQLEKLREIRKFFQLCYQIKGLGIDTPPPHLKSRYEKPPASAWLTGG